jgi:deazaflavin-dependent oxidoreductase (nitroreductase family)
MAKTYQAPSFVRLANMMTTTLLRIGVKLNGPGKVPMYLLTVRGRKSGKLRTIPVVILNKDGLRYIMSPFGIVDWVRNLRAAKEAIIMRGLRTEKVQAVELSKSEGGLVLKKSLEGGIPSFLTKYFEVAPDASPEEFEQAATIHPVFLLQNIT